MFENNLRVRCLSHYVRLQVEFADPNVPTFIKAATMHGHCLYAFGYGNFNGHAPQLGHLNMDTMAWTKLTATDGAIEDGGKLMFVAPYDPAA